jgi:hypothetical protein
MGLKLASIQKAVGAAFKALGEVVSTATYRRTTSVYTPATGAMVKTNTDYTVPMVFLSFNAYEIDRVVVVVGDRKALIEKRNLSVYPNVTTDTVVHNSKSYNIVRFIEDPSNSVITLHLRAP